MANMNKELSKSEKKVRRLYALVWFLACPLVFVLASLLGFHGINIVYWTLLIVPILLAVYNVHQVPPVRKKSVAPAPSDMAAEAGEAENAVDPADNGVSTVKRAQLTALALKVPVLIAAPILVTLIVDIVFRLQK